MTTIKPPGDANSAMPTAVTSAADESAGAAEFQALLDAPAVDAAPGPTQVAELSGDLAPLLDQVRSGELTSDGAVQVLIERALQGVGPTLDAAGRTELESVLRSALESDPNLIALRNTAREP